ncbi:MAG TPA: twin-arginine translocase subunit TatC [Candidatus Caenarcaniphilales bacterium]|nr:twin-arginine translocase subunit TatC [Candidatus Caenarcaniphilales bacterium]
MTLVDHLTELRRRIFISLLAVVVGTVIGWVAAPDAIRLLNAPIEGPLLFRQPGGAFFLRLKLAMMIGIALASPIMLYQFWAFVSPGLTPRERRVARPWVPLAIIFLVAGIAVAYAILPITIGFLLGFEIPGVLEAAIFAEDYFGFVTSMFLAFGLVMEFPILLVLLAKVGLVSPSRLRRARRYVMLGIFVFAVVVTPGGDPFSPLIMALVMYPLYELTIYLVSRTERPVSPDE